MGQTLDKANYSDERVSSKQAGEQLKITVESKQFIYSVNDTKRSNPGVMNQRSSDPRVL